MPHRIASDKPLPRLERAPCNFCGSPRADLVYEARDFIYDVDPRSYRLVRCRRCALVYLNPRPVAEDIPATYPDLYFWHQADDAPAKTPSLDAILERLYFRRLFYRRASWADRLLGGRRDAAVLDVGCGRGGFLKVLHQMKHSNLHGIEIESQSVARLRKECPEIRVTRGDFLEKAEKWSAGRKRYDLITLWHVLEHLHDPKLALRRCAQLLKPGGRLILGTQNFNSLTRRILRGKWPLNDIPRHLYHFTRPTLKAYLEEAGFAQDGQWRLTESYPVMGGHLALPLIVRRDHTIRALPGVLACLAFSPAELAISLAGYGCILTVSAVKRL